MMEYRLVIQMCDHGYDPSDDLVKRVNVLIKKGWLPQGGIAVLQFNPNVGMLIQALIRHGTRETKKDEEDCV